jgi:hypothetical protein
MENIIAGEEPKVTVILVILCAALSLNNFIA